MNGPSINRETQSPAGSFGEQFLQKAYSGRFNYTNVKAQAPVGKTPGRPSIGEISIPSGAAGRTPFSGYVVTRRGVGFGADLR